MQPPYSPTVRRRRLSAELKRLRSEAGMTMAEVATESGWQTSKVAKIETGERKKVTAADLTALLDCYKVSESQKREALNALAKDAKDRGWWAKYRDAFRGALPGFEAEASAIRTFEAQVIPGLLQTPEYAYEMFRATQLLADDEIHRKVESRIQRQAVLNHHKPPSLQAIIDEAVLRRLVGGPVVMREQISHLTHMAVRHNITICVLPFSGGAHAGSAAPFTILDFLEPLDPSIVCIETTTQDLYVEETADIERYNVVFSSVQGSALSPTQSLDFLKDLATSSER